MNEVSVVLAANLSGDDWWSGVPEEDAALPMPLDASEFGLWAGTFVPPPPRPLFLDDATPDGLTTCDLCSWAWQNGNAFAIDATIAPGEIGWVFTLVIVSIISAIVGAGVMITVLHCKRLKSSANADNNQRGTSTRNGVRPPISTPSDKSLNSEPAYPPIRDTSGVWSWLTSKKNVTGPSQLSSRAASATENHYTHMDETYAAVGEALYAELDRDSNSPAYQNSAYTDPDAPTSSAPSSAYYSDLSVSTVPERAYEVVGLTSMPSWESRQPPVRLAAIRETAGTIPSDYV